MAAQNDMQSVPVTMYRTADRLTVAAPMPGLQAEDIAVEVTVNGRLTVHGELRGVLKDDKEVVLEEWTVGPYHRELSLPAAVDGELNAS